MKAIRIARRSNHFWPLPFRSIIIVLTVLLLVTFTLFQTGGRIVEADTSIGNVSVGINPFAVAVNPVTNKIYVANSGAASVTVIDGTNNSTTTITVGTNPRAVAVNTVTNKIYVANQNSNNVTVIDGSNNSTTTVAAGSGPNSVALNPVTNKIYVANFNGNVTVIDGINNSTTSVTTASGLTAIAANPVTNKIYVTNGNVNNVTVIDGINNSTATVATGSVPVAVALNPVTNKIYVANDNSNNVTVIDGTNNSTTTVVAGSTPSAVAINPVTNKIYVANKGNANVTVIDGTNNSTTTVAAGSNPQVVTLNPVTNKIYIVNNGSNNVTVIDGTNNSTTPVTTGTAPQAGAVNPVTNKIYVTNQVTVNVTVIDGSYNTIATINTFAFPAAGTVNPVTNKFYFVNPTSDTVTVYDDTNNIRTTVSVGTNPVAVAVNSITNKIYVANSASGNVTVIDGGAAPTTTTITAGTNPRSVAVNPVTNKIYVANEGSNNVTVIDGTNNSTTTIAAGNTPGPVAVNAVTNKIYVTNFTSNNVTVIDGSNSSTTTVATGINPNAITVNPVTNKIYVTNLNSNSVTVIDGTTNSTTSVAVGIQPRAVTVNPATNKIYSADNATVTVIDGANNSTTTLAGGGNSKAIAVNPATNKIYAADLSFATLMVIDGTNNSMSQIIPVSGPIGIVVNPVTNKVYISSDSSQDLTVITPAPTAAIPLNTAVTPLAGNTTTSTTPTLTLTATSTYSPTAPPPQNIYFQMDSANGAWKTATNTGSTSTTVTANATPTALQPGVHIMYFFATDGSDATSINPLTGKLSDAKRGLPVGLDSPESSPVTGGINSYLFMVAPAGSTPTLGNYPATNVNLSGNTTITPDAAPTGTTSITVTAPAGFNGRFSAGPFAGIIRLTNAQPAKLPPGAYPITVRAFGPGGTVSKTFNLTVTTTACSGSGFTSPAAPQVTVGSGPFSVAVADFNGDGTQDFAAANQSSTTVSIRLGNGSGGFTSPAMPEVTVGAGPISVAVGDFNGDGNQDFAASNDGSNNVSIRLGTGIGGFTSPAVPEVTVGSLPRSVAVGDFNGDGILDFATTNANSNNVSIRLGNGSGGFTSPAVPEVTVGSNPISVAVGDFNGDGIQDFAAATQGTDNVSIRLGNGTGGFTSPAVPEVTVGSDPRSVAVGDFNGDGNQDFAAANQSSNNVSIRLGNGSGGFTSPAVPQVTVGTNTFSVAISDFNGDGNQDFAAANVNTNNISIRLGNGSGGFTSPTVPEVTLANGSSPASVAVGDFNGDGRQDFATANVGSNNVSIRLGTCSASPGSLQFSAASYSFAESIGAGGQITVTRTGGSDGAVSVQYNTTVGSASGGASCTTGVDYVTTSGTLSFAQGETSKTFNVTICDDAVFEGNESLNLNLSTPTGGATIGTPQTAPLTIIDNDPPPTLSVSSPTLVEGNSGTTAFTFSITKTGSTSLPATVTYATADGSATAPGDYTSIPPTQVTFTSADTVKNIFVLVNGDTIDEGNENFFFNLSAPMNATILNGQGTATIVNDDAPLPDQSFGLDGNFNAGVTDASTQNYVSTIQPDGKILVGGGFSFVNGVRQPGCCFVRLNPDGTADTSFNVGGTGSDALDIVVLGDGKILMGGGGTTYNGTMTGLLKRLNPDGTLDTTFNSGGTGAAGGGRITSIAVQPDGKIIAAGQGVTTYNGVTRNGLFRVNADGTLDTSFVPGLPAGSGSSVEQVAVTSNNKLLIALDSSTTYNGTPVSTLIRVNLDGTLDTTFNLGGAGPDGPSYGLAIQPDNKIIVGGGFSTYNGTARNAMARLNEDGTLDASFVPPPSSYVEYVVVQPDGKILAAGASNPANGFGRPVTRLNSDGTQDASPISTADGEGYHVSLQPDGKFIAVGNFSQFSSGESRIGIARFNATGSIDQAFTTLLTGFATVSVMTQQTDGKTIVGGDFHRANGTLSNNIARFNADGTLDSTFLIGTGAASARSTALFFAPVNALAIQPDGKILVGGYFSNFNGSGKRVLARLNPNGSVDSSFTLTGDVNLDFFPNVEDIFVQADGKIVVGGTLRKLSGGGQVRGFLRLNSDGSVDETFNSGGASANNAVNRIFRQPDGKFIIGGSFATYNGTSRPRIARINNDGTLDTSFTPGTGANSTVADAALQSDGKIVIVGAFTAYNGTPVNRIARLNSDGTLDTGLNTGIGANNVVYSVVLQPDGKINVGGQFINIGGMVRNRFARLNSDGSVDGTIGSAFTGTGFNFVSSILREPDGKLLLGGLFTTYNGFARNSLVRLFDTNAFGGCQTIPIVYGQSINGNLNAGSCVFSGPTDLYTFSGTAGQQIAISMDAAVGGIQGTSLQLVAPDQAVTQGASTGINARIPASGFFTLPSTGTYTIRASASPGSAGDYILSLTQMPVAVCNYSVSPTSTNVIPGGGTFYFDVLTGAGCPSVTATTGANSGHIQILSNTGGRVTFAVQAHTGALTREGSIVVNSGTPQTHMVLQTGVDPPGNNFFEAGQVLPGMSGVVSGYNTNATAEGGEPTHAGNTAVRSVWYKWTAPTSDLYSFTTSGSDFDTVMAIYTGTSVSALTRIGENDDTTTFDQSSKINFRATAGVTYSIAVDGKAGASGNIVLGYSRYRRLFRLYLQNFNGFPSPISPASVTAKRQDNTGPTINGTFVSLGVYEFDLPDDNSPYIATIAGPVGITWVPSTYLIDNTSARFNELMMGASGGGQNQTSNPTNTIPRHFKGYIHGISTTQGLAALRTQIATTGSTSAVPPKSCFDPTDPNTIPPELVPGGPNGTMRVRYDCITQPNSTSQIVPNAPSTAFQVPVLNLPVLNSDTGPSSANAITATASETYNISGRALNGANGLSGVDIDISSGSLAARVTTTGDGSYTFANLAPGLVYTLRAARDGFIFQSQTVNLQAPGATVDLTALTCNYTLTGNGGFGGGAGTGQFSVTATTSQACGWTAVRDSNWIDILSGSSVGNGSVQFSVAPNPGLARQGGVTVGNQSFTITQASGCSFTATPAGSLNFPASGGSGGFTVTASDAACSQTTTTNDYCMVNPGAGTTGNAPVSFTINANFGVARSALINIGGQPFTITQAAAAGTHRTRYDFDGDGKADISLYRPGTPIEWYLQQSTAGFFGMQWGGPGDKVVPADYDGDGKTDIAVFRPSEQRWYLANSGGTFPSFVFGLAGDIPTPADYDGDGKADLSVFRPSDGTWYRQNSSNGAFLAFQFGTSGDRPMVGDYDGDGKSDLAVFRPTTNEWYSQNSGNGAINALQFGINGDNPAPADYDGDGKTDVAVFRSSTGYWYWQNSSNGAFPSIQFGLPGDIPVAADYNGDKSADIAVYRPSSGVWYIWSCTINPLNSTTLFGLPTDVPLAFVNVP